jgi:hypothetical protein
LVAVAATFVAVGVGLLPHPIKNGLTITAVVAILVLLSGLVAVVVGVRTAMRAQSRVGKVGVATAAVISVAVALSIVAPAVAATNVLDTDVTTTPSSLGLEFETSYVASGANERVDVWTIDGAGHTDGYETQPELWEQRVIAFLDEMLL